MPEDSRTGVLVYLAAKKVIRTYLMSVAIVVAFLLKRRSGKRGRGAGRRSYRLLERIPHQIGFLSRMVHLSDSDCISNLRMDRNAFGKLCTILKLRGGLSDSRYVCVEQQVAMFLGVLSHHNKNQVTGFNFLHSGETVSHYLHCVISAILSLHGLFLAAPSPINDDCNDYQWKHFPGFLGALDGTFFHLTVPAVDKPRFRNRKGHISTNTLACCDPQLRFTYLLPGWEGSAADGYILRDAVGRANGLKVPRGTYYLCDNGFANSEGFLTPYKCVRYHLKDWGPDAEQPQNLVEIFNMRHTKARNVIERAFGILKMRWGILRSPSFYPVKVQIRLIMCCFLLHNFIRSEMSEDPIEVMMDALGDEGTIEGVSEQGDPRDFIDTIEGGAGWSDFRDELAGKIWEDYDA